MNWRAPLLSILVLVLTSVSFPGGGRLAQAGTPEHVILISVDGLMPAAIHEAFTPHIDTLASWSATSFEARTILPPKTVPSHASMLSGLDSSTHRLFDNGFDGGDRIGFPTVLDWVDRSGLKSSAVVAKRKLGQILSEDPNPSFSESLYLPNPWRLDRLLTVWGPLNKWKKWYLLHKAREVTSRVKRVLREEKPNFLFIHFADVDRAGHLYGWMERRQLEAVETVDMAIGQIVATLHDEGLWEKTVIILTADHGGTGRNHGHFRNGKKVEDFDNLSEDQFRLEDLTIPWIASGAGLGGRTLELGSVSPIRTYDTAATILDLLDIPVPDEFLGRPVLSRD